jgi:hypothetical protein
MCACIRDDGYSIDVDQGDLGRIKELAGSGHGEVLGRIFKRPIDKMIKGFWG